MLYDNAGILVKDCGSPYETPELVIDGKYYGYQNVTCTGKAKEWVERTRLKNGSIFVFVWMDQLILEPAPNYRVL